MKYTDTGGTENIATTSTARPHTFLSGIRNQLEKEYLAVNATVNVLDADTQSTDYNRFVEIMQKAPTSSLSLIHISEPTRPY